MGMIIELRQRWLHKWRGRTNSAKAKADIKFFASVVGFPIDLPEAMLDLLVLLVIPPDPLHIVLLGKFNLDFILQSHDKRVFVKSIQPLYFQFMFL